MLLSPEEVRFGAVASLNPATLLPNMEPGAWVPHDCHQILAETPGTREDLTDQPLSEAEQTWYTKGSSFCKMVSESRGGSGGWTDYYMNQHLVARDLGTKSETHSAYSSPKKGLRKKD